MSEVSERRPVAVDLFAGAGGFSLGVEQAGFDVVAAVELDPVHAATHKLNFPRSTILCKDIQKVTGREVRAEARLGDEPIDAVIGGPPCQGFSLIGHRVLEDPRNSLVFHFSRLILELRPRTFVIENVPGMATGAHTQLLEELIARFRRSGYELRLPYRTLNAASFGVPQERERLFLLGADAEAGVAIPRYPAPQTRPQRANGNGIRHSSLDLFAAPKTPTVSEALGDLPEVEEYPELFDDDEMPAAYSAGSDYALRLRGDLVDPEDFSYPRQYDRERLSGCRRARHTETSQQRFAATTGGSTEPVSRFFKLALDGTSNTLRAGTSSARGAFSAPRPIHPIQPRCITVREAARLHSFPDWFRFHRTIWHGFRQIGNSVPPLLGRAVGRELVRALGVEPERPASSIPLGSEKLARFSMRQAAGHFGVPSDVIPPRRRVGDR